MPEPDKSTESEPERGVVPFRGPSVGSTVAARGIRDQGGTCGWRRRCQSRSQRPTLGRTGQIPPPLSATFLVSAPFVEGFGVTISACVLFRVGRRRPGVRGRPLLIRTPSLPMAARRKTLNKQRASRPCRRPVAFVAVTGHARPLRPPEFQPSLQSDNRPTPASRPGPVSAGFTRPARPLCSSRTPPGSTPLRLVPVPGLP